MSSSVEKPVLLIKMLLTFIDSQLMLRFTEYMARQPLPNSLTVGVNVTKLARCWKIGTNNEYTDVQ